jgi:hypothetical protein
MRTNGVQSLLIGGQACVLYGAAEFSRDTDLAVLADPANLGRLRSALAELDARVIAVPPFEAEFLERGHAIHFECQRPDAAGMRVDVMARLRSVDPFQILWDRRTTLTVADGALDIDLIALPDLVKSKKTQRDKDWPMIRRLVEVDYFGRTTDPSHERIGFWLRELRTAVLLIEVARTWPAFARDVEPKRPAVRAALTGDEYTVHAALAAEERAEQEADRQYWAPLRAQLEQLRHEARRRETS